MTSVSGDQGQETQDKLSPSYQLEHYDKRPLTPPTLPQYQAEPGPEPEPESGYSAAVGVSYSSLSDVDPVCGLPGYISVCGDQDQDTTSLPLYKVTEVDYLSSAEQDPHLVSVAPEHCKVPVYEVSDPRLDLSTGQVHIHIDLSDNSDPNSEVLNLSSASVHTDQDLSPDPVLTTYYDMSSTVTMDETESAAGGHSSYPYFNGSGAGAALGANTGSSASSPYSLSNRAYSDPASAYNLYSQYYGAAAYPYGMNFGGTGSTSSTAGFGTKGEYGSSYYGSYASWTGNPYR